MSVREIRQKLIELGLAAERTDQVIVDALRANARNHREANPVEVFAKRRAARKSARSMMIVGSIVGSIDTILGLLIRSGGDYTIQVFYLIPFALGTAACVFWTFGFIKW